MAFLDNSGDIILDAVLTDLGRKRMAEGNFRITQFALGDDEIDYSLYNKDHPSGSAYYDLEILQTPVFEAFTRENANINYGLLTFDGNSQLFYLPSLIINQLAPNAAKETNGIVYLAANNTTYNLLKDPSVGALSQNQVLDQGATNYYFGFETGLNNASDPAGTYNFRQSYLVNTGLIDNEFTLMCDGRFLTAVHPIDTNSRFNYPENSGNGPPDVQINLKGPGGTLAPMAGGAGVVGQRTYILPSIPNTVYNNDGKELNTSVIDGPRGTFTAFNFGVPPELQSESTDSTPSKFSLYGRVGVTAAQAGVGGSNTYDIIDTIVYLNGNTSGANTQLIVRIIRQAS